MLEKSLTRPVSLKEIVTRRKIKHLTYFGEIKA